MRRFRIIILLFLIIPVLTGSAAADQVFPPGTDILCGFDLSGADFNIGDTLVISRTIENNEFFPLTGLYFSDNLPPSFRVASYSLRLNGGNIDHFYSGASQDSVIGFYDTYYWVVDDPDFSKDIVNTIYPGDVVELDIKVVFRQVGVFSLPMHTAVFYGNEGGYFATDNAFSVTVLGSNMCGDINNTGDVNILDVTYLINYLYKDGPAPEPSEKGDVNASGNVNLLDVSHLIKYLYKDGPPPICL